MMNKILDVIKNEINCSHIEISLDTIMTVIIEMCDYSFPIYSSQKISDVVTEMSENMSAKELTNFTQQINTESKEFREKLLCAIITNIIKNKEDIINGNCKYKPIIGRIINIEKE